MSDEDLNDSPLFSLFLSSPHYPVASSQQLIVAVPPTASLSLLGRPSLSVLECHVLRKSPYFQDQYLTLSGKSVLLSDSSLHCKSGFAEQRTVQVVGQETYYDEQFQSFQVLRVNLPLEGKVAPDYFRQLTQSEGEDRGIERRSLAEHEQLISRLTGDPIIPFTGSGSAGGGGSTGGSGSGSVFHSLHKFVHQFNASYVLVKGFIEHAGLKVSDACARLREDVVAKAKARGTDLHLVRRSLVEAQLAVDSLVMAHVYKKLFSGLCELYSKEEDNTQRHIARMRALTQAELGIREDIQCNPQVAMALLAQLPALPTVALKLAQLEDVSRALTQAVKDHARGRGGAEAGREGRQGEGHRAECGGHDPSHAVHGAALRAAARAGAPAAAAPLPPEPAGGRLRAPAGAPRQLPSRLSNHRQRQRGGRRRRKRRCPSNRRGVRSARGDIVFGLGGLLPRLFPRLSVAVLVLLPRLQSRADAVHLLLSRFPLLLPSQPLALLLPSAAPLPRRLPSHGRRLPPSRAKYPPFLSAASQPALLVHSDLSLR